MKNIIFGLLIFPFYVHAVDNNPSEFSTPEQEQRYQELIKELRCVVCQNQSVADSNAELAQDVRNLVRDQIHDGQTDQQISSFMVERYGDFVLYDPPFNSKTYLLWGLPLLLTLIAIISFIYFTRKHVQTTSVSTDLTKDEQAKIKQALGE
ncbi:cytochrome c-type biogenesis protein CcmH [Candidatus Halobeggiatoa sp. HSG11]|nr:cytochrome c-type biogenesis protein CcmH [Candidatus Halobeggiatoa sp. HSG11]